MNSKDLLNDLLKLGVEVKTNVPLKDYSTFRCGGNAEFMAFPDSASKLKETILYLKSINYPYFVLGNGSNVLISDSGYKGVIVSTLKANKIEFKGSLAICEAGAKLSRLIDGMLYNSLSGLEFAVSIPATVGGAVSMNAGAYSKTVGESVCYVLTENKTYTYKECLFDYRKSRFLNDETIIKVCFNLTPSESDIIEDKIKAYKSFRKNPKGNTCGSVFKNDGYFAGKIIDEAGLKGAKIGGATVSEQHANFIINNGASASDIYNLIKLVKEKVYNLKQISLVEEVIYLGDFK